MARESVQELIVRIKQEGLGNLEFLKKELKQVSSQSKISEGSIESLQKEIKQFGEATKQSTIGLKGQIAAFEKLRAQTNFQGQAYQSLTKDLVNLNKELKIRAGIEKELDAGKEAARRRGGSISAGPESDAAILKSRAAAGPTTEKAFADRMGSLQALLVTRTWQNISDAQRKFLVEFKTGENNLYDMKNVRGSAQAFKDMISASNAAYRDIEFREGKGKGRHTFNNADLVAQEEKLNATQMAALNIQEDLNITSKRYVDLLVKINAETGKNNRQLGARDAEVANREAMARAEVIRTTDLTRQQEARAKSFLYSNQRALYGSQIGGITGTQEGTYFGGKGMGPATREFQAKMQGAQLFQTIIGGLIPAWRSPTMKAMMAEQADERRPYLKGFRKDRTDISNQFPSFMDWQKTGYGELPKGSAYSKLVRTTMGEGIQQTIKDPLGLGLNPKYPKTEFGLGQEMKQLAEMLPHLENGTKPWLAITEKIEEKQKEINKLIETGTKAIEARKKKIAETVNPNVNQKLLPPARTLGDKNRYNIMGAAGVFDTGFTAEQYGPQLETQDQLITRLQKTIKVRTNSIKTISEHRNKLEEIRKTLAPTSAKFKSVAKSIEQADKSLAKLNKTSKGFGKKGLLGFGQSVLGGAYFGGPFGAVGAGIGQIFGGQAGAATGGLVGAQVGRPISEFVGGSTTYAADIAKSQIALTKATEVKGADGFVDQAASAQSLAIAMQTAKRAVEDFNVPQDLAMKGMTRLSAAVIGAGGNVHNAARAFYNITAAIKGTAGGVEDTKAAITAMVQIYSKGKVSAEELSGQLGERFPAAVTKFQLANQDIYPTTAALQKALKDGTVGLAQLEKFLIVLGDEFVGTAKKIGASSEEAGERAKRAVDSARLAIGKQLKELGAAFQVIGEQVITELVPALIDMATGFASMIKAVLPAVNLLAKSFVFLIKNFHTIASVVAVSGGVMAGLAAKFLVAKVAVDGFRLVLTSLKLRFVYKGFIALAGALKAATIAQWKFNFAALKNPYILIAAGVTAATIALYRMATAHDRMVAKLEAGQGGEKGIKGAQKQAIKYRNSIEKLRLEIKKLEQDGSGGGELGINGVLIMEKKAQIEDYKNKIKEITEAVESFREAVAGGTPWDDAAAKLFEALESLSKGKSSPLESLAQDLKEVGKGIEQFYVNTFKKMEDALTNFVMTGKLNFKEFARSIIADITRMFVRYSILAPLFGGLKLPGFGTGTKSLSREAKGGVYSNGIRKFAYGGIVNRPTLFPFAKGVGLMGEAGPEAIMPLKRGKDGKLGVAGGGDTVVNISVDAKGTSVEGQDNQAKMLGKMLSTAVQAEIARQKRPGGILS